MNKKRTQICFNVQEEFKILIKMAAARRNISMNLWIMRAMQKELARENIQKGDVLS